MSVLLTYIEPGQNIIWLSWKPFLFYFTDQLYESKTPSIAWIYWAIIFAWPRMVFNFFLSTHLGFSIILIFTPLLFDIIYIVFLKTSDGCRLTNVRWKGPCDFNKFPNIVISQFCICLRVFAFLNSYVPIIYIYIYIYI